MTAIETRHLNAFYGRSQALYDVSLTLPEKSITALMGPSGCGKSTFIRCLNRLHEEIPAAYATGEVLVNGTNLYDSSIDPQYVRRNIGMVFQRPNPLPMRSIFENVAIGPRINGVASGKALQDLIELSLHRANLWDEVKDRLQAKAATLSGGQQQRLCIARALAMEPQIVLMDEPTSALDPISTMQVEDLIRTLKNKYTIIIVTHNLQQAARISDQTAFFLLGHLIEAGATKELFENPTQKETKDYITGRFS
jgi:phosphate transport system ATP-binding protein